MYRIVAESLQSFSWRRSGRAYLSEAQVSLIRTPKLKVISSLVFGDQHDAECHVRSSVPVSATNTPAATLADVPRHIEDAGAKSIHAQK